MQITIGVDEIKRLAKAFKFLKGNLLYERIALLNHNGAYYFGGTDEIRTLFLPVTAKVQDYKELVGIPLGILDKVFGKAPVSIVVTDGIVTLKFGVTEIKAGALEMVKLTYPTDEGKIPTNNLKLNKLKIGKTGANRFINVVQNWIYTSPDGTSIDRTETPFPTSNHIAIPAPGYDFEITHVGYDENQFILYGVEATMVLQHSAELLPVFDLDLASIQIDQRQVNTNVADFLRVTRGTPVIFTQNRLQANLDGTEITLEWQGPNIFGKFIIDAVPETIIFCKLGGDYILVLQFDGYERIIAEVA